MKRTGRATHKTAGRVPDPRCDSCQTKMVPASATEWKCIHAGCPENGIPKTTGVFPTEGPPKGVSG